MAQHNDIGKWGEALAREYLIKDGYAIVETNARIGHYELDIVAMHADKIVFVEVKTRAAGEITDPLEAIDEKKMRRLCRAAEAYIEARNIPYEARFDVFSIVGTPSMPAESVKIIHIADAFTPPLTAR